MPLLLPLLYYAVVIIISLLFLQNIQVILLNFVWKGIYKGNVDRTCHIKRFLSNIVVSLEQAYREYASNVRQEYARVKRSSHLTRTRYSHIDASGTTSFGLGWLLRKKIVRWGGPLSLIRSLKNRTTLNSRIVEAFHYSESCANFCERLKKQLNHNYGQG